MTVTTRLLWSAAALMIGATLTTHSDAALADAQHKHKTAAIGEPGKATAKTRTVQITLGDNYYEPASLTVKAGETVRFVLKNTGQLLHEFNIGTAAMHAEHQEQMAMMMDHGMLTPTGINQTMTNMDHANMPGKTKELVWKFSRTADLEFACNMPGHYQAGMVGKVDFQR
jgi:uncharacterized cupredoxin-like copper-binding protein